MPFSVIQTYIEKMSVFPSLAYWEAVMALAQWDAGTLPFKLTMFAFPPHPPPHHTTQGPHLINKEGPELFNFALWLHCTGAAGCGAARLMQSTFHTKLRREWCKEVMEDLCPKGSRLSGGKKTKIKAIQDQHGDRHGLIFNKWGEQEEVLRTP